ncbi:hypothetical protein A1OW_18285 [Enterovibrio norvegicus]|uniref:hypothetical protein n=1 Tax=Enterovibrio norvegicus TaxID=188144 RepID=UPI000381B801|nr:hypothetical protein [Enterovibrio norvegicus]OEF62847.1 hypothetical protein A1OW_18285 [Enterovibrio norvegicus]
MKKFLLLIFALNTDLAYANTEVFSYMRQSLSSNEMRLQEVTDILFQYKPESLKAIYCKDIANKMTDNDLDIIFKHVPREDFEDFTRLETERKQYIYEEHEGKDVGILFYRIRLYDQGGSFKQGLIQFRDNPVCLYTIAFLPSTITREFKFNLEK